MNKYLEKLLMRLHSGYLSRASNYFYVGWSWWLGQLLELLPARVRQSIDNARHKTYLQISGTEVVAFLGKPDRMQETGRCEMGADPTAASSMLASNNNVVLLLPENATLRKSITLPAAAEDNLRAVLAYEMDEQTPFDAEQVYYDYIVTGRSSEHRQIHIDWAILGTSTDTHRLTRGTARKYRQIAGINGKQRITAGYSYYQVRHGYGVRCQSATQGTTTDKVSCGTTTEHRTCSFVS